MQKRTSLQNILSLLVIGFIVLLIFAGSLISGQIEEAVSDTERALENRAEIVASRLEDTFKQTRERVEIIALNPVIQARNPQTITECFAEIMELSPSYEALFVLDTDGSPVAGAPVGYGFDFLVRNYDLYELVDECKILLADNEYGEDNYVFASAAQSLSDNESEGRLVIALTNLKHIAQATLLGNAGDRISLWVGSNEMILSNPGVGLQKEPVPGIIAVLSRIATRKTPAYLQGTASVPKPKWVVTVSRPYDTFLLNNMKARFSNYHFYVLLFLPVVLIFVAIILVINQSRHVLKDLASKDSLTGLYNRRFFQNALQTEIAEHKDRSVSLLMIDVDDFKHFNDTYGHQMGDRILKGIAAVLLSNIRSTDIAARYGGEEFTVVLPGIKPDDALTVAQRIRQAVMKDCNNTVSIGVSSFPEYANTAEELIQGADKAMYKAKRLSKNRVEGAWNLN